MAKPKACWQHRHGYQYRKCENGVSANVKIIISGGWHRRQKSEM
jgi:hypothetical protein